MIIHWRAHLNSVQNAVGYMIKPTMAQFFAAPEGFAGVFVSETANPQYSTETAEAKYKATTQRQQYTAKDYSE